MNIKHRLPGTYASDIIQDPSSRLVSDSQINSWNSRLRLMPNTGSYATETESPVFYDNSAWIRRSGAVSTASVGHGFTVVKGSGSFYYERQYLDYVDPRWFGAIPDVNQTATGSLNWSALWRSIQYAGSIGVKRVVIPGYFYVNPTSSITIGESIVIEGVGAKIDRTGLAMASGSNYTGSLFRINDSVTIRDLAMWSTNRIDNRFTHTAIETVDNSVRWFRMDNSFLYGFDTGLKLQGYFHNVASTRINACNDAVYSSGSVVGIFPDTGANTFYGVQITDCTRYGFNINTSTDYWITDCTLERNGYHVYTKNSTVSIKDSYLGDDPIYSIWQDGGSLELNNSWDKPIHGGGYNLIPSGSSPRTNWQTGGIRLNGGRLRVLGGNFNNCIFAGNGFTNEPAYGGFGQNRGSAIVVTSGSLYISGTRSNVYSQIDTSGSGTVVFEDSMNNFIIGGSLRNEAKAAFDANLPTSSFYPTTSSVRTPMGAKLYEISGSSATFAYRVPSAYIGKQMYLAVLCYQASTFASVLYPENGGGGNIRSSGWSPATGSAFIGSQFSSGNSWFALQPSQYTDSSPVMNWMPCTIASGSGTFSLYSSPGALRIGGVWLTDFENFQRMSGFTDINTDRYSFDGTFPKSGSFVDTEIVRRDAFSGWIRRNGSWYEYPQPRMITSGSTPITSDIDAGASVLWKNTGNNTVRWYVNDGGTLRSGSAFS